MAADKGLRTAGRGRPVPEVTGVLRRVRGDLQGNMGFGDVRGRLKTRVITLNSFGGTDEFKIRVEFSSSRTNELQPGKEGTVETVAFVRGTNATAAAIQAELRTLTGDAALTVSGSTDAGPFTVTQGDTTSAHRQQWEFSLVDLVGCSGNVTSAAVSYSSSLGLPGAAHKHGTDTGVSTPTSPGRGAGAEVALGYSIVTDGGGQTAQTTLAPVTIDSAVGGNDQVAISGTEVASGGTGAVVGYAIFETLTDNPHSIVYAEDADGDVTVSGLLDATDYYVVGFTQTVVGTDASERSRVSRATAPEFFTTT